MYICRISLNNFHDNPRSRNKTDHRPENNGIASKNDKIKQCDQINVPALPGSLRMANKL